MSINHGFTSIYNLHLTMVGSSDHWLACVPIDNREYLLIKRWFDPNGFVLCCYLSDVERYCKEENFPDFESAMQRFLEVLAEKINTATA